MHHGCITFFTSNIVTFIYVELQLLPLPPLCHVTSCIHVQRQGNIQKMYGPRLVVQSLQLGEKIYRCFIILWLYYMWFQICKRSFIIKTNVMDLCKICKFFYHPRLIEQIYIEYVRVFLSSKTNVMDVYKICKSSFIVKD